MSALLAYPTLPLLKFLKKLIVHLVEMKQIKLEELQTEWLNMSHNILRSASTSMGCGMTVHARRGNNALTLAGRGQRGLPKGRRDAADGSKGSGDQRG